MVGQLEMLTIQLPADTARRLRRVAEISGRAVDDVIADTITASLPPMLEDVPSEFQQDLSALEKLSSTELRSVMVAHLASRRQVRLHKLLALQTEGQLSLAKQQELSTLRLEADRLMFQKAYAAVLLKWRGERLPNLAELEASH